MINLFSKIAKPTKLKPRKITLLEFMGID